MNVKIEILTKLGMFTSSTIECNDEEYKTMISLLTPFDEKNYPDGVLTLETDNGTVLISINILKESIIQIINIK